MFRCVLPICIVGTLLLTALGRPSGRLRFEDVTSAVGLVQPEDGPKWGGPCVGDVDNDGVYDLVLNNHASLNTTLYYGTRRGTFIKSGFTLDSDLHGVSVGQRVATSRNRMFTVSRGGGRGANPSPPYVYEISRNRQIVDISSEHGLGKRGNRGRTVIFMDLAMKSSSERRRNEGGPDMLILGFLGRIGNLKQFAYENVRGSFKMRSIPVLEDEKKGNVLVTDIDNDGYLEVISITSMLIYKLVKPFQFQDFTSTYIEDDDRIVRGSGSAMAELDMDNDGDFDLYVATADPEIWTPDIPRRSTLGNEWSDRLYENRNGTYVDVSEEAGIPKGTNSMGVTVEDFNNDGFVDILVILYYEADLLLLNQGDGTFKRVDPSIPKRKGVVGNHAVAVDYNRDGRVDVVVSQGSKGEGPMDGKFLVLLNTMTMGDDSHFVHVRVGDAPNRGATALHALVTVIAGKLKMTRRVGSRGSQTGGDSLIDTVHFGLGSSKMVDRIEVVWSNGVVRGKNNRRANRKYTLGLTR